MAQDSNHNHDRRFENKIALITGSTDGIGYAIAKTLGLGGATVIVSSRKEKNVTDALNSLRSLNIKCDGITCHAGKLEDIKKLVSFTIKKYSKIDILIPQVGINPSPLNFWDITDEQLHKMFNTNLFAPFYLIREAKKYMPNGSSITLHSTVGSYSIIPFVGFYCVSKTALNSLTKLLYQDLTPKYNIRVNCVATGSTKTKFLKSLENQVKNGKKKFNMDVADIIGGHLSNMAKAYDVKIDASKFYHQHNLMKRVATPQEIANVFAFLSSDESSFITGEIIVAGGGCIVSRL